MDINSFLISLFQTLSKHNFVKNVEIKREAFVVKGRIILINDRFVHVYFNELTKTMAFALIADGNRIWGIDFDNLRGWHKHPFENPLSHINIAERSIEEIIASLARIWNL